MKQAGRWVRSWWVAGGAVLALVAAVALYAGLEPGNRPPPSLDQQVREVASQLRCLQCQGLSAWDSNTESSLQMRAEIRQLLEQGFSEDEILQQYVDRYGSWVLITPSLRGFSALAYVVPAAGLLVGAWMIRRLLRAGARRNDGRATDSRPDGEREVQGRGGGSLVDEALRRYEGYDG